LGAPVADMVQTLWIGFVMILIMFWLPGSAFTLGAA
jgi:hypothetical protein